MWVSDIFIKKTKRGSVQKVVREHYLRDDIGCGSSLCTTCVHDESAKLDENLGSKSTDYLIVDTNVVLHQIDVLEDQSFTNVIILQTVLGEVRHKHLPIYKRLLDLLRNGERHFYHFINEHHMETYVQRDAGESSNDRNDRAIRKAAKWYQAHLKDKGNIKIILLTNDADNKTKAKNEKIRTFTFSEYVSKCHHHLSDRLAKLDEDSKNWESGKVAIYSDHLSLPEIHSGIKKGKLLQGNFLASRENYNEAYVSVEDKDEMIFIQNRIDQNRAIHNDTVAIELLPESEWTVPSEVVLLDETEGESCDNTHEMPRTVKKNIKMKPTGKIVGIIKKQFKQYCGILQPSPLTNARRHMFIPADKRIPRIKIETRQAEILKDQRLLVAIDSWDKRSRNPWGHLVKQLGPVGSKETENEVLLLEHDVPHSAFSQMVEECLPKLPWIITDEDIAVRQDFRDLDVCSVDPPGCTDIDDALHWRKLSNENYEVGVHIADVSHFIRPNTALDEEAANRGTTVYLVDKRIDMVPALLSSNLCSLIAKEDRFSFSCIWEMTPNADILDVKFTKSIIRSRASLTYAEAQMIIDTPSRNDNLAISLRKLNELSKILRQRRFDKGALVLASPEIRFTVDSETCEPIDVKSKELLETNSMIEEFMLLANISVAEKIYQFFPECALLRRHPIPPPGNFDLLIKAAKAQGFKISINDGKSLSNSLDNAVKADTPYFNTMIRMLATRCMTQAIYFSSGAEEKQDFFHYGLACPIYTHFTSPIRRYADIIVHRLLAVAIDADATYPELLESKKTQKLCFNLNYRHKMGQYAGRASVDLNTHIFFKSKETEEEGYVFFVKKNALQILIPKFGLEIPLFLKPKHSSQDSVPFIYNEDEPSQTIAGVKVQLFDKVVVRITIDSSNIQHQKLQIKLVKPQIPGFSVPSLQSDEEPPPAKRKKTS